MNYVVGIDEVGRGPLAGPVVFCACAAEEGFNILELFPKKILKDSKKLTEKARIEIVEKLQEHIRKEKIILGIGEVSASEIDKNGLAHALKKAQDTAMEKLLEQGVSTASKVFLDGGLKIEGFTSETIIQGDEKVPVIALASIFAKVHRDNYMKKIGEVYKEYGFERHVGYGTRAHIEAIKKHGITKEHRKSFLENIIG